MAEEAPAEQAIVFHIEVPSVTGLPKPEVTYVTLAGLGLEEDYTSEAQVEESETPGPWLFQTLEALAEAKRLKAEAEAAQGKKKKDDKEDSRPASIDPPSAVCRIARPCKTAAERQRLLDSACAPLRVKLFRMGATPMELGEASLQLSALIHDTASLDVDLELQWSEALMTELRAEFDERVAAEAAAKAEAAAAAAAAEGEAEAEQEEVAEEEPPQFVAPAVGRLLLKISTAAPMGRILCPEDLHDWAVLTTRIDGIYHLPQKLLEAGGPLPELGTAEGVLESHPLRYAVRLLGCDFNGGQLTLPHVDLPEAPEGDDAAPEAEDPSAEPQTPESPQVDISFDIGTEEFQEGLMRAGYPLARTDGPAVFSFLCRPRTGLGGRIGLHDFLRLQEIHLPASTEQLLELHSALIEKHESLEMAFSDMDAAADGVLTRESLAKGIEDLGLSKTPEEVEALFVSLDTSRTGSVSREDLRVLSVEKRKSDMTTACKAVKWLVAASGGSFAKLLEQVDDQMTGSISKENFLAAAQRLGLADTVGVELAFTFAQLLEGAESLSHRSFLSLESLELSEQVPSMLVKLEELLLHGSAELPGATQGQLALQQLLPNAEEPVESVNCHEFVEGLSQVEDGEGGQGLSAPSAQCLFFILDGAAVGTLDALAFSSLPAVNAAAQWRRLANCRRFIESGFGGIEANVFRALFEGNAEEVFQEAEENLPQVLFDTGKVQVAYRGREWLQRLLNTLGDDRGRNPVQDALSKTGGTWLYMFPTLQGQDTLLDYKELPDAQLGHGKLARWHHAHAFVDLRRLLAPCKGPELEFRAYLTQVDTAMPGEFPESEWPAAYQPCRSYVKGVISLDRPLERLCPRDLQPAVTVSGEAYIPPPPAKRPPPTVNEELEKEAAAIIARLSFEFARWCYDSGYIESKIVGPGGELSPNPVLGKKGVVRRAFLQWLEQDSEGASLKDLGNALRPAVVRLMRAENKNGPACGLCGNENDAKYTYLRDYIARHMFRALNNEVEANRRKRDEQIWRSPQENAQDADAADSWQKQDAMLKRLTVEYELVGNWHRAREVYEEWLALETNVENGQAWFSFARFLMRTGAHQLDAEGVLRYAISLRTEEEGPDLQEVAFLACLLENHRLPSSLDEGGRSARFQAALAMMEAYADRNAFERLPMHIIFLLYAAEAEGLRQMAAADGMSEEQAMQLAEESDRLSAEASKYLELARTSPEKWQGTLEVMPSFPELTQLTTKESLNRGNSTEVPSEVPETPAAWRPSVAPMPFPDAEALRTKAETEDAMALQVIDLLLHFGISDLADFLLEGAVQAYGYLSPVTVQSERCQLQMVKVAMLAKDWGKVETLFSDLFSRRGGDRWPEAHALLGECRYRAARDKGATSVGYASALEAFETALCFMTEETSGPKEDPVLQLRVGSILHLKSEEENFSDAAVAERAVKHYKKSAMVAPTAEAWKNIGLCRYRQVKLQATTSRKEKKLKEAMKYFQEANVLDRERPDILAWLTICAVELGLVQVAKQGFRQLMQFEERLETPVALELASLLLRFSNEQRAADWGGERGRLVQNGRYSKEAAILSKVILGRGEDAPRARNILAWCKFLDGDHGAAAGEFCASMSAADDPEFLEEAAYMARHCASMIPGEPQLAALVEEAIAVACEPQQVPEDESGLGLDDGEENPEVMETPRPEDLP